MPEEISTTLQVRGMDCEEEVKTVNATLKPLPGVRDVQVNLMAEKVIVTHGPEVSPEALIAAIQREGLEATIGRQKQEARSTAQQRLHRLTVVLSGLFLGAGLILSWAGTKPFATILEALSMIAGGWFIVPQAIAALRRRTLDMNMLMTIAVVGAAGIGEWGEGAAVAFLFGLSELLESFSISRARHAIGSLLNLSPETAIIRRDNIDQEIPVDKVQVNDIVIVKSGARVPVDGVVTLGESAVNQAPITGESLPVEKKGGDNVFAGSINGEGSLQVRVSRLASDSTLARIIHMVEEAQAQKASAQRFVDIFARYYTPSVFLAAIAVFLIPPLLTGAGWSQWFYRALVLLVIACPCALVISTPVSIVSGLTAMARRGVLIKGGAFLEMIGKLRALALDKTGTITEGRPRVTEVIAECGQEQEQIVRIAASVDAHSTHPLAEAVVQYAAQHEIKHPEGIEYQSLTGRGATARIDGHEYFVGNHRFAHELGVCSERIEQKLAKLEGQGQSVIVVGHTPHNGCVGEVLGILSIGDTVRPEASGAIRALHRIGVKKVVMLSGDNQRTVNAIAKQAGIDEGVGELLPEDKTAQVRALLTEHRYVGMVGDGVNDAPAMAVATVGIAMGAAGSDTAIEAADITLMQDDLTKLAATIQLGRRTLRIIQTNIIFALAIKALFLALALFGYTSLWLAILVDTGATLLVILNALRLLR
jgi:Cd2+/Zn2+-exporting ATPase